MLTSFHFDWLKNQPQGSGVVTAAALVTAVARVWSLAQELPCAVGTGKKTKTKTKKTPKPPNHKHTHTKNQPQGLMASTHIDMATWERNTVLPQLKWQMLCESLKSREADHFISGFLEPAQLQVQSKPSSQCLEMNDWMAGWIWGCVFQVRHNWSKPCWSMALVINRHGCTRVTSCCLQQLNHHFLSLGLQDQN